MRWPPLRAYAVTVHANDLDGTELYEYTVTSGSSGTPTPAYLERDDSRRRDLDHDESGAPSGHAAYDPFGGLTSSSAGFPSTRWQGSWYEANSGLYYVIARWYSPTLGEFLSDDPLSHDTTDPQARDPYAYASGDPIGWQRPFRPVHSRAGSISGMRRKIRSGSPPRRPAPVTATAIAARIIPAGIIPAQRLLGRRLHLSLLEGLSQSGSPVRTRNTNASQLMGCGAPLGHVKATSKHPEMFGQGCLVTSAAMVISYMFGKPYHAP